MNFREWLELNEGPAGHTFKGWYNYNRGKWSDVEKLAAQSPKLQAFLKQIEDEVQYGQFDRFADPLQKYVDKRMPGHSKYELDPVKRHQDLQAQAGGGRPKQPQGQALGSGPIPQGATRDMNANGQTPRTGSGSNDATAAWTPNPQGSTDVTQTVHNHEMRLAALEKLFTQFQSGQYQRQRA
jgi:hypothetical protein